MLAEMTMLACYNDYDWWLCCTLFLVGHADWLAIVSMLAGYVDWLAIVSMLPGYAGYDGWLDIISISLYA
jgi:hypothetical protein